MYCSVPNESMYCSVPNESMYCSVPNKRMNYIRVTCSDTAAPWMAIDGADCIINAAMALETMLD